jgi:MFS transporter, FHS family, L-fucose permease
MELAPSLHGRALSTDLLEDSVRLSSSSETAWARWRLLLTHTSLVRIASPPSPDITERDLVCGPPRYAEFRINLSQAFNGVGTVVAPVLGSYVFFLHVGEDAQALKNVQWVYLAIACFVFLLAVVFYFSPIPEITDADMAFQAEESHANHDAKPFIKQYRLFHAAFAQFCYCGSQVAIAGYFINYVTETRPGTSSALASKFLAGAQGAFTMGRFTGVLLMKFIRPRYIFLFYFTMVIVFVTPSITQRGNIGMSMLFVTLFFESIIFPTIVALGMRGLGKYTKRGSGVIVGGVIGGACVPPLLGAAADINNSTATAMSVPLAFFIAAWSYPLCVNFLPAYKESVDRFHVTKVGVAGENDSQEGVKEVIDDVEKAHARTVEMGGKDAMENESRVVA